MYYCNSFFLQFSTNLLVYVIMHDSVKLEFGCPLRFEVELNHLANLRLSNASLTADKFYVTF